MRYINAAGADIAHKVVDLRVNGYGMKAIATATELSHSPIEGICMEMQYFWVEGGEVVEATTSNIVALRDYFGISWGAIGVMCQIPEGKVRKMYKEGSGKEDRAQRIGHGGRFFAGKAELYEGGLKRTGTEVPLGKLGEAEQIAATQRIMRQSFADLKAQADELGVTYSAKITPAGLAKKILAAQQG